MPPDDLRRYFTNFYYTEITVPKGGAVQDILQPEWANLRFFDGEAPDSWMTGGEHLTGTHFVATGPSTRCRNFSMGTTRFWGFGFLPMGWARFFGQSAADHANLAVNGYDHPTFASFVPLADTLFGTPPDVAGEYRRIVDFFRSLPPRSLPDEHRIHAIHAALVNPHLVSVSELVEQIGASQRTVERLCHRHFGFSPKLLLRRQRFMRSLAQFMLDPSLNWIGAMDSTYHDQAQFVREFREFMGMAPSEYAALPHPILEKFMIDRARVHGAPVQIMDQPGTSAGAA